MSTVTIKEILNNRDMNERYMFDNLIWQLNNISGVDLITYDDNDARLFSNCYNLATIFTAKLQIIEREIDWSKVPVGTRIKCWDIVSGIDKHHAGIFLCYTKTYAGDDEYPFIIVRDDKARSMRYEHCEIIEDIKEGWYK